MKAVKAGKHEIWLLLRHENPMVSHDHLEYVVLWKHKPEGRLDRASLRDASTVRLNEVFRTLLV
jgi:hypothetical protein